ncbi:Holliday junction branch migration protein RuvA [Magnetospirillum molischianum]|uniref:Holliday junction branch migration complex subunit RuvA n=1 Tax=Magnetospirillum molischianum DSM 120 TaxID=1150626 RepID=H8FNV6_MAGML|nr:Holliday junction branch migration protein RuvA [Magnetospirillum molischianum]CCG40044.1 Holliday junction DNA helicase ruvA [Magnetospirillum molischianum DSM 120]
MIARLRGTVDSVGEDWAVIDVGGVGYLVSCSARTLARLVLGTGVVLLVETHVREDAIQLYGFAESGERDWFRLLTTVQGVGARVALSILSVLPPDQLLRTLAAGDKAGLTRANGVGPKLALRILTELKDKAGGIASVPPGTVTASAGGSGTFAPPASGPIEDAVSALVNLGYRRLEAFEAVGIVAAELGETAEVPALIGTALKRLGRDMLR